jgi:hypothetical protein
MTTAVTAWWVFQPILQSPVDNDLTLVFIGARIGLEQGWNNIYSLDLQHQLFTQIRPGATFGDGERFLSPPPVAWIVAPVVYLGADNVFYIWLGVSVLALAAAWWLAAPGKGLTRWLWLLAALAWYPVQYSLALGQPAALVLLAVVGCWWLAEAGLPLIAGIVLALSVLKPQLVIALPLVLLVGGHWRTAAAWAATTIFLAIASVLVIGPQGFNDYRSLLSEAQQVTNNRYFTLAFFLGPGPFSYLAQAGVIVAGLVGAYLNRGRSLARLVALGIITSALAASYWHLQDFAILLAAAWLFWRDNPPAWQRVWLLPVAVTAELAWPLGPAPILVAIAVWMLLLIAPGERAGFPEELGRGNLPAQ